MTRALPSQREPESKRWNPDADLDGDDMVTVADLMIVVSSLLDRDCRQGG